MQSTPSSPDAVDRASPKRAPSRRAIVVLVVCSIAIPLVALFAILASNDDGGADETLPSTSLPSGLTRATKARVGDVAPDFALTGLDGRRVVLSELRGKPVILTFFASWCHPCEEELPVLEKVQNEHPDDVQVVAINFQDNPTDSRRFIDDLDVTFPALEQDRAKNPVADRYDVRWIPQTFFIDAKGIVRDRIFGQGSQKDLQPSIDELLGS